LVAAIAFQTIMQSGWESVATTFQFALLNGGPAAMIYGGILAGFGASFVAISLAELASMYVFFQSHNHALFNFSQVIPW